MTSIVKTLTPAEIARAQQQAQQIASSARATVSSNQFVFFAAFDGTNNDRNDLAESGDKQSTAVGQLEDQISSATNISSRYYPGVGTDSTQIGSEALPTAQVIATAERAYGDFQVAASEWLEINPGGSVTTMMTSFSRGGGSAVVFAQMLYQRGLTATDGTLLIPPGQVGVAANLMIEPVFTGINGNLALPPGMAENSVLISAENEQRTLFKSVDLQDPDLRRLNAIGNHGDVGSFYDSGLSGIYLEGYTDFFQNSGLTIADVPANRRFDATKPVVIHTEGVDAFGNRIWDEYDGPRQTDVVAKPTNIQRFEDGSSLVMFDDITGQRSVAILDAQGRTIAVKTIGANQATLDRHRADAIVAGVDLFDALRHKNTLGAASAVIRLTEASRRAAELAPLPELQAAGGALMMLGALNGFGSNTPDAQKFANAARLVLGANEVYSALNNGKGFLDATAGLTPLNALSSVVSVVSLKSALESGNPFAIASAMIGTVNAIGFLGGATTALISIPTPLTIGLAIASVLFNDLFGDEPTYPDPPPAGTLEVGTLTDGTTGFLLKDDAGKVYQQRRFDGQVLSHPSIVMRATDTYNWAMGADVLTTRMKTLRTELDAQAQKSGKTLQLDRLPSLTVNAYPSFVGNGVDNFFYSLSFDDPRNGSRQTLGVARQDLSKTFAEVVDYAGGLVTPTEAAHLAMKKAVAVANATATEGQWLDKSSGVEANDSLLTTAQAQAQATSNRQTYSLLTLDLEGDGVTTKALATGAAAGAKTLDDLKADTTLGRARFDADNDGFAELTQWVGAKEGILGIDRDGDGALTHAHELLTGGELSNSAENLGVKRLAWFDANNDGKLTALDPYFQQFRFWVDLNGDARSGAGEVRTLTELGVTGINVNTGAVTFADNQTLTLKRTQLTAEVQGLRAQAVTDGNGNVMAGQYTVQVEGQAPQLNLTADAATDLSEVLKLARDTDLSTADRARLKALAARYGVNTSDPLALLGLGGGGNQSGTPTSTTAGDITNINAALASAPNAAEVKAALASFFNQLTLNPAAGSPAQARVFNGTEDQVLRIKKADLLAGLAPGLTLVSVQDARRGVLSRDSVTGDVLYTPTVDQNGTGYFTYTVKNSQNKLSIGMVWLNLAAVNDAPVAKNDSFSTLEDTPLVLSSSQLLANDTDVDIAVNNQTLSIKSVSGAVNGTVSLVNGQVTFTPTANWQSSGSPLTTGSFTYTLADNLGGTSTGKAFIKVIGANDAPTSAGKTDKILAKEDTLLRIEKSTLLSYAKDADISYGDSLRVVSVISATKGQALLQADGSILFNPAANQNGDAQLIYRVADSQGATVDLAVTVNLNATNDAPTAVLDSYSQAKEDTTIRIAPSILLNNDSDVDWTTGQMDTLRVTALGNVQGGTAFIDSKDGSVVFTPTANFNGNASLMYTLSDGNGGTGTAKLTIAVAAVNDAPVIVTPIAAQTVAEDTALTINASTLLAGVSDVDINTNGQKLRLASVSNAVNGTVSLNSSGNVVFKGKANYNGVASFSYTVVDDAGGSVTSQATVNVTAVNDAPKPKAQTFNLLEDEARTWSTAALIGTPALVDPDSATNGDMLSISAVSFISGDESKGQLTLDNIGNVNFTPTANYNGTVTFNYTVTDRAGASGSNTVTLNLAALNDAPVAAYKTINSDALEDTPLRINFSDLISGATDVDGDLLTLQSVTPVSNGTVSIDSAAQQVVFTGAANFSGTARFAYTLQDPSGATSSQFVDVNLAAVNDNPTVNAVTGFTVNEDGIDSNNQGQNDWNWVTFTREQFLQSVGAADVDGNTLRLDQVSSFSRLNAELTSDGGVRVRLDQNYSGAAGLNYRVTDDQGGYADGYLGFEVAARNDAPTVTLTSVFNRTISGSSGGRGSHPVVKSVPGEQWVVLTSQDIDSSLSDLSWEISQNPLHGVFPGGFGQSYTQYVKTPTGIRAKTTVVSADSKVLFYDSTYGDTYNGIVTSQIRVKDGAGGEGYVSVETKHAGSTASSGGKPVALDLDGDGLEFTHLNDSKVLFDVNKDGLQDLLAWTAADDGILIYDKNGDGQASDWDEISFVSYLPGAQTDLEGLKAFDTNDDNKLNAGDALWKKFGVWQDKNQNGITDAGEFRSLDQRSIRDIGLVSDKKQRQYGDDVLVLGESRFTRTNGSTGTVGDAVFGYIDGQQLAEVSPSASDADLQRLLSQFVAQSAAVPSSTGGITSAAELTPWTAAQYADPTLLDAQRRQQVSHA